MLKKTKWMYAYFPKEVEFFGVNKNFERIRMLIRQGTYCKIQEVDPVTIKIKHETKKEKSTN